MNFHAEVGRLKTLIKSYFREDFKRFCHYGDCRIYSVTRPLCDCGLLYRLGHIDSTLARLIYPDFEDQLYLQETGKMKHPKQTKKQIAEAMKLLEEVFGKIEEPSFEEIKMDYDEMYKVINTVFSPRMFPAVFKRLEKWLANEVNRGK